MNKLQAIVLAAGKSTRFNTGKTKLLEKICGREMILYPTTLLEQLHIPTIVVIGYQAEEVKEAITKKHSNVSFVVQEEPRGTGHALLCTKEQWNQDTLLVLNGDAPLITKEIIINAIEKHKESNAAITFVTSCNTDPVISKGYGRVIKHESSIQIVEEKELTGDTAEYCCLNAGIYLINKKFLEKSISHITDDNNAQEFYITDLVKIANQKNLPIETIKAPFDNIRGINTLKELWSSEQIRRAEIISRLMTHGVRFDAPQTIHIDIDTHIGAGSKIGCGVYLINGTRIGKNCIIESFTIINNTEIGDNSYIRTHSVIHDARIGDHATIGPFVHVRDGAVLESHVTIGNFVEVKQSTIGNQSKAKHLSFIGNATIGDKVNLGAGTITCNYNGIEKHNTTIKDNAFIGSNNTLVAPLTIGKNAYTAAGSVITEDVPDEALAIGRNRQVNKEGYAKKIKGKQQKTNQKLSFLGAIKQTKPKQLLSE